MPTRSRSDRTRLSDSSESKRSSRHGVKRRKYSSKSKMRSHISLIKTKTPMEIQDKSLIQNVEELLQTEDLNLKQIGFLNDFIIALKESYDDEEIMSERILKLRKIKVLDDKINKELKKKNITISQGDTRSFRRGSNGSIYISQRDLLDSLKVNSFIERLKDKIFEEKHSV